MQLYMIRHGQSVNNHIWIRTGSNKGRNEDPDLTVTGERQAQALAQFIREADRKAINSGMEYDVTNVNGFHLTHLYSSLMLRAVRTGAAIADKTGLPLTALDDLHEEGGIYLEDEETGEYRGMPGKDFRYLSSHFPNLSLPEAMNRNGWWNRPYEPVENRPLRAQRLLELLLARHGNGNDRVACVTHGGFYELLVKEILALQTTSMIWFTFNNTAISRFDIFPDKRCVCYLNRTDFLPDALKTQ
jgi:broad specificity phosphatase PhoE